jgi:hypothetical protein
MRHILAIPQFHQQQKSALRFRIDLKQNIKPTAMARRKI